MENFSFYTPTYLAFGRGEHRNIGMLMKPFADRAMVVYGSNRVKKSGLLDVVLSSLAAAGIEAVEFGGVQPNPHVSLVREGINLARAEKVDAVLGIGGGSVIDTAKSVAIGVFVEGDIWDEVFSRYGGNPKKPAITKSLPIATILTLPGTGSELSDSAVLKEESSHTKYGIHEDLIKPTVSVIDPELFFTLPKNQIANGVSDMMSHIMERYFTPTLRTDLTDALCEATLRTIMKNAPNLIKNPDDYDAWCEIAYAGTLAHCDLLGAGRVQDWVCHQLEHEIGALYDTAHGAGLAMLTPNWMKYVHAAGEDIFLQFAVNVMGVTGGFRAKESVILEGIERLRLFFDRLGLPATFSELGIENPSIREMAEKYTGLAFGLEERPRGGIVKIFSKDAMAIYEKCL